MLHHLFPLVTEEIDGQLEQDSKCKLAEKPFETVKIVWFRLDVSLGTLNRFFLFKTFNVTINKPGTA